jgi:hypothetical protein
MKNICYMCVLRTIVALAAAVVATNITTASAQAQLSGCGNHSVAIVVEPALVASVRIGLNQFENDLCASGFNTVEHSSGFANPPSLRAYLGELYGQQGPNLAGAILIGDIPHAYQWVTSYSSNPSIPSTSEEAISFQYYADLNGTFAKSAAYASPGGHEYSYDLHSGDVGWEIWVGVLPRYKGNLQQTTAAINRYFAKNHAYRSRQLQRPSVFLQINEHFHATTLTEHDELMAFMRSGPYSWTPYSNAAGARLYFDSPPGGLSVQQGYTDMQDGVADFTVTDTHGYWGASGQLTIATVETMPVKTLFFWSNGCAVGDLDHTDNFLASVLYSPTSDVLVAKGTTNDSGGMGNNSNGFFGHNIASALASGAVFGDAVRSHVNVPLIWPWSLSREFHFGTVVILGDPTLRRITTYELARVGAEFSEVLSGAPGQASVLALAGGFESSGASRGPAFQLFDSAGTLQTTQFVLNPDFRIDVSFVVGNFDADTAGEILVGGQETSGLARGPAYQLFDSNGAFIFTRFVLNPDFSDVSFSSLNVGSNGVLACGQEIDGLARGPAYQAFDANGNLVRTQFVLNADFTMDDSCMGTNLDGVAGEEVITAGREVTGLGRGPAFQVFGSDGSFRLTRFVLNPDFTETKFTVVDVGGSKNIVVSGRETSGLVRGPAYQVFDAIGNFILTRFVLNQEFTTFQLFGANTTNGVSGQEIVTGGLETGGLARGAAIQVWDKNGNHLFTRLVLNPDFTEVTFSKIDINNDGLDEILVVGRETKGLQRGPAFQLFDGNGNLLVTQFVLNADFTNLKPFAVDQNGDGDKEIGIGGTETSGLMRGPAYQIFEFNGALLQTRFVLNPDF